MGKNPPPLLTLPPHTHTHPCSPSQHCLTRDDRLLGQLQAPLHTSWCEADPRLASPPPRTPREAPSRPYFWVQEEVALGWPAVSPRPPDLLHVALEGLGHVVVHHPAHVGLVQAHAKGHGGHHHPQLAGHEVALHTAALGSRQAGMIGVSDPFRGAAETLPGCAERETGGLRTETALGPHLLPGSAKSRGRSREKATAGLWPAFGWGGWVGGLLQAQANWPTPQVSVLQSPSQACPFVVLAGDEMPPSLSPPESCHHRVAGEQLCGVPGLGSRPASPSSPVPSRLGLFLASLAKGEGLAG